MMTTQDVDTPEVDEDNEGHVAAMNITYGQGTSHALQLKVHMHQNCMA